MKPDEVDAKKLDERRAAMMGIVGLWKDRADLPDTETYVRSLRDGSRLKNLIAQWRSDKD
jgi:hypothetical protein